MRALGYLVIDTLVEHFAGLGSKPPFAKRSRPALESVLREPPPEEPGDPAALVRFVNDTVLQSMSHVDHPRFFAFVPSPGNFVGTMADALASGFNCFVGTWFAGSGPAEIELVTVDWLRQLCGFPDAAGGLFVSGGSMANLTALAAARHERLGYDTADAVVYFSDQTHSSVERALRVLGFSPAQVTKIPAGPDFRLPVDALEREIAADRGAGRFPFCIVANAGTTNTGAVDPLPELAEICRRERLWLHADGAYGAAAVLSEDGRRALAGLDQVDSLSLDPHKWLFQPFECGCVLVRDAAWLKATFRMTPEYLRDVHRFEEEVNFCDRGVQLTRAFRALKLWLSLKTFGLRAFRAAVDRGFRLAEAAERRLCQSGLWDIVTPAQLAIVSFRWRGSDSITQQLVAALAADGYALLTSTVLEGRPALRFCTINPRTTEPEIDETIARLEASARSLVPPRS